MKKFVDLETGHIHFENGAIVKEGDSLEYVQELNLGQESKILDMNNGWVWYSVNNVPFYEVFIHLRFAFFNNHLNQVRYTINPNVKDEIQHFENEPLEKSLYQYYKQWALENIGRMGRYNWGEVICNYSDADGPYAFMAVRFNNIKFGERLLYDKNNNK